MSTVRANKSEIAVASVSVDMLRIVSIILAIAGIFIAGYMAWAEMTGNETVCSDTGKIDCAAVQTSAYAEIMGFPVAVMGTLGFVAILAVLLLEDQIPLLAAYGRTLVLGMAVFGVIFQFYLTLIEAFVLDAWCQWCVASFVSITLIAVLAVIRVQKLLAALNA